ncbi:MAG: hypothetical protein KGV50_06500 [Gammaproteobacteria bacterium]|nr:hypothetical protein [Gammaproteobacteria bacterium]
MGKNTAKISTEKNYQEEKASLLQKIDWFTKQNKELLGENETLKNSLQNASKPNLSQSLRTGNVLEMSSSMTEKENKKYDELYSKYKQLLDGYNAIKEKGISDDEVQSHKTYLSLLKSYELLEQKIQDSENKNEKSIKNNEKTKVNNKDTEATKNFESDLLSAQEEIKTILNNNPNVKNKK